MELYELFGVWRGSIVRGMDDLMNLYIYCVGN